MDSWSENLLQDSSQISPFQFGCSIVRRHLSESTPQQSINV